VTTTNDYQRDLVAGLDEAFGSRMRRAREPRMSQQRLATLLNERYGFGWHQTTAGKVESGERPAKLAEAVAISLVLGVPLDELVFEDVTSVRRAAAADLAYDELYAVQESIGRRMLGLREKAMDALEPDAKARWRAQQDGGGDGGEHRAAT
jgi:hypothetical protein